MADIELHIDDAERVQHIHHQLLDFDIRFQSGVAVYFGPSLKRLAAFAQACGQGVQHTAGITKSGYTLAVKQMCVDPCDLRGGIGADTHSAAR